MKLFKKTVAYVLTLVLVISTIVPIPQITASAATNNYVKSLTVKKKIEVVKGNKTTISVKVKTVGNVSKKLTVKSKNKKIAKVTYKASKNLITVKGAKKGNTKITVTTKGKNKNNKKISKTIKVSVVEDTKTDDGSKSDNTQQTDTNKNDTATDTTKQQVPATQEDPAKPSEPSKETEPAKPSEPSKETEPSKPSNPDTKEEEIDLSKVKISNTGKVLNIHTWNDEFPHRLADHYPGFVPNDADDVTKGGKIGDVEVKFIINSSENNKYRKNLDSVLKGNTQASADDIADIFLVESDYAFNYTNTDNTVPVKALGIEKSELSDQYGYTQDILKDSKGVLKGVTWQACPGVMIYNREVAKDVFGTDDPDTIQKQFSDWDKYAAAAVNLKEKGYKITANVAETFRLFQEKTATPWIVDGNINIDNSIKNWVDMSKNFVDSGISEVGSIWDNKWSAGLYPDGKVFCYFGPDWLINYCMNSDDEASIAAKGGWGVCEGPQGFYWGGSFICAANGTDNSELVADIFRKLTVDKDIMKEIATEDKDFVNNKSVMNELSSESDYNNPILGGQNPLAQFSNSADSISITAKANDDYYLYNENFMDAMNDYFIFFFETYDEAVDVSAKLMSGESTEIPAKEISLSSSSIHLYLGEYSSLNATVLPYSATDKELVFESDDESVVDVDDYGNINPRSEGAATITVTNKKSGVSAECTVRVESRYLRNIYLKDEYANEDFTYTIDIKYVNGHGEGTITLYSNLEPYELKNNIECEIEQPNGNFYNFYNITTNDSGEDELIIVHENNYGDKGVLERYTIKYVKYPDPITVSSNYEGIDEEYTKFKNGFWTYTAEVDSLPTDEELRAIEFTYGDNKKATLSEYVSRHEDYIYTGFWMDDVYMNVTFRLQTKC